jgi:hypothetical protein
MLNRDNMVDSRLQELASGFAGYLKAFDEQVAPTKPVHYEYHAMTIQARRELGSASAAIRDQRFLALLRETLIAWGIGIRGPHLVLDPEFREAFAAVENEVCYLDGLCIDDPSLDLDRVAPALWRLIERLDIVEPGGGRLVPCSKAIHHLLPDLVMPMDRLYTRTFFLCRRKQFDAYHGRFFDRAFRSLAKLAQEVSPAQYVGDGWHTSRTKVIDNALVGYCKLHPLWLE